MSADEHRTEDLSPAAEAPPGEAPPEPGPPAPASQLSSHEREALRVTLEAFEGPLDLLLHLIRRERVDIHDIPIARITHQYLETIESMQLLDLEVAGEFLIMAATLMRIKARTLLPPSPIESDEEEQGDPRGELVRRLLEYRKYKEVATRLRSLEERRSRRHAKGYTPRVDSDAPLPLKPISLFRLVDVLREVLTRQQTAERVHAVELPPVTIEERMEHIRELLAGAWGQLRFEEVLADCRARVEIITTFVALLELIRLGEVLVRQYEDFGDIWVFDPERLALAAREPAADGPEPAPAADRSHAAPAMAAAERETP